MKHPPVRAVFFDLDDTLCDAAPAFAYARELAFVSLQSRHPHLEIDRICQAWDAAHASLFAALAAGTLDMQGVRDRRFLRTLEALKVPDAALADALNYLLGEQQLARLRLFDDAEVLDVLRPRRSVPHSFAMISLIRRSASNPPPRKSLPPLRAGTRTSLMRSRPRGVATSRPTPGRC